MVKITIQYITKRGSPNAPKNLKDLKEHVRKMTHLYLNDQYVDSIGDISLCQNLKVLFLQNNQLEKIENLHFASNLTHLYLQRNKISKMQGFEGLVSLKKLYLGYNAISVVEGLENAKYLQELHLENQKLCPGEEIVFDPRTIAALGLTLQIFNLQGNSLTSLEDLVGLGKLKTLLVGSNKLSDVAKIQAFLTAVPSLLELDMRNNPVIQDYKNRDRILASAQNLCLFNEKQISPTTLDFLKKFEVHQQKTTVQKSSMTSNTLIKTLSELAHNLPEGLAKDVTSSIFKDVGLRTNEVRGGQIDADPTEIMLSTTTDGPFFHFPAFKSSTCLQYDGRTIPKPFHRKVLLDANLGQKHRPPMKFKAHLPANIPGRNEKTRTDVVNNEGFSQVQDGASGDKG